MNFKTVLVIASLVLTAGLTSCKSGEAEAPKTDTVAPAADVKPVDPAKAPDAKPGDAMKPEGKTDAKPGDAMKPEGKTDEKKGDVKPGDKKDEKKAN